MGRGCFTQEVSLPDVFKAIEAAFKDENIPRVEALLWPALEQFPDVSQLWFYGGCIFFKKGICAVARELFEKAIDLDDAAHVYSNLGACYRRMNLQEEGKAVLAKALDRDPDYAPTLVNMGSMFVNEGIPKQGIPYLEKACALGTERGATWNLGLLYLESARFGEGFDCYRKGLNHERMVRNFGGKDGIPEPKLLEPHDIRQGKKLIVWGEQGIGDELMFGTILEQARQDFGEVIFECHPRLLNLHRWAHNGLKLYPTRKDEHIAWPLNDQIIADYKCGIGDLGALYRRTTADFTRAWGRTGPTYEADAPETTRYIENLESIANGRPIVGLATRGGVMQTSRTYRTLKPAEVDALFGQTDCLFVALDYDDMMPFSHYVHDKFGEHRYKWWPSIVQHWDYDHTAALIAACDLTVTVCQTAAHISAGMGCPTRVLTPQRCAWRYAPIEDPERWYWYPDSAIKLYRQSDPESWAEPMARVIEDIKGLSS